MKSEEMKLKKITAGKGKVLSDGEIFGRVIYLGLDRNEEEFYEITEDEYVSLMEKAKDII